MRGKAKKKIKSSNDLLFPSALLFGQLMQRELSRAEGCSLLSGCCEDISEAPRSAEMPGQQGYAPSRAQKKKKKSKK